MCGINGIISQFEIPNLEERTLRMNKSIQHRGPDANHTKIFSNKMAMGHLRLSIIDLSDNAAQPMVSNSGSTWIIFNGEIFNFLSIKKELQPYYQFNTTSDTEVVLAAYEIKGLDWLLAHINGMFAIAIYDVARHKQILIRDHFGIKPLFYFHSNDLTIFSSEIKGILESGLIDTDCDDAAIDDYLAYRYVREPYTFFKNIYQSKAAQCLIFEKGKMMSDKIYWHLPNLNFSTIFNENQILQELDFKLKNVVKEWRISDVKLGSYLSGGVDSSLLTALLAQPSNASIDTYTIGFSDKDYNEFSYAQMVADKYHTRHREFLLSRNDYFSQLEKLIQFKDSPLAVPNEIPLAIMTKNLSNDITVVLSGEGADELFGGYGKIFRAAFDFNHHHISGNFYSYFIHQYEYIDRQLRTQLLRSENNRRELYDQQNESEFQQYSNEENIFRFFYRYHIKGLLHRIDMASMQASIEARPPFLDHNLVEYVFKEIPYDLKLKWNSNSAYISAKTQWAKTYSETLDTPKYILKKLAENYLPNEVIYRKKMGFPVPLSNWIDSLKKLSANYLVKTNWLNEVFFNKFITDDNFYHVEKNGQFVWMLLNIEIFKQKYFNKNYKY